jgi:CRP/FNR family transcriptional regulator
MHASPALAPGSQSHTDTESIGKTKFFRAGCPLFIEGDNAEYVFRVLKGRVHLTTSGAAGPASMLRVATEGDFLGISSALLQRPYEGIAVAAVPTTVEAISRELFLQVLNHIPGFGAKIAAALAGEYSEIVEHSKRLQLVGNTQERIARLLVGCIGGDGPGVPFEMPYTHDEIGGMIGRSRETVTRTFTLFKQRGIINLDDRMLKILRPDCLLILAGPFREADSARPESGSLPASAMRALQPRLPANLAIENRRTKETPSASMRHFS